MTWPFKEWRAGSRPSAADENAKAMELLRVGQSPGGGGASGVEGNQGFPPETRPLLARIVGKAQATVNLLTPYNFHLVNLQDAASRQPPLAATDPWSTLEDWDEVAYELTGNTAVPVDGSALVWLRPSYANSEYLFFEYHEIQRWGRTKSTYVDDGAWEEVEPVDGGWSPKLNGYSGDRDLNPLIEITGYPAGPNLVVPIWRGHCSGAPYLKIWHAQRGGGGQNTIQGLVIGPGAAGGTFTLTFDGQETADIAYNATAATLKAALEALSNIGTVTITGTGVDGDPFLIRFDDSTLIDYPLLLADTEDLKSDQQWVFRFEHRPWAYIHSGGEDAAYGWYEVTPDGGHTFAEVANGRKSILDRNLAYEENGNTTVPNGTYALLKLGKTHAVDVTLTAVGEDPADLQLFIENAGGGTFTISLGGDVTAELNFNANPSEIEAALETLDGIDTADVSGAGTQADPFLITLTFTGDPELIEIDESDLRDKQDWLFDYCCRPNIYDEDEDPDGDDIVLASCEDEAKYFPFEDDLTTPLDTMHVVFTGCVSTTVTLTLLPGGGGPGGTYGWQGSSGLVTIVFSTSTGTDIGLEGACITTSLTMWKCTASAPCAHNPGGESEATGKDICDNENPSESFYAALAPYSTAINAGDNACIKNGEVAFKFANLDIEGADEWEGYVFRGAP